ncbi:MAG: helix-turn-helix transcriptional regulator [Selenomonadaceae bacterium]|nr:helix-turn-helix transcriptional regulator [Selenomonadaceae bacterium]
MSVSGNIVRLRENLGLTQKELAEALNMNRSVLNRIEMAHVLFAMTSWQFLLIISTCQRIIYWVARHLRQSPSLMNKQPCSKDLTRLTRQGKNCWSLY